MSTQYHLAGTDYGIFVFGRAILAKNPTAHLTFFYKVDSSSGENVLTESQAWPNATEKLLPDGVLFDHHRQDILHWSTDLGIQAFPAQALHHLAEEGLADSVEFRRLARKFIRQAKTHNCRSLFFPEAIFADPKTQKILQHLAGSQLKIQTPKLPATKTPPSTTDSRSITVYHDQADITFLKARAEKLLGTKLKITDFKTL